MKHRRVKIALAVAPLLGFVTVVATGGCTSLLGDYAVDGTASQGEGGPGADGSNPGADGSVVGSDATTSADADAGGDAACQAPGSPTFDDAIKVAAGYGHTCAIRQNGALYCWGDNSFGQLGVPQATAVSSAKPLAVQFPSSFGNARITDVVANEKTTMAIDSQLRLWVWGNNEVGVRGDGTRDAVPHSDPTFVKLGSAQLSVRKAIFQWFTACALTTTNDMYCWGNAILGSLGPNGGTTNSDVPVKAFSAITPPSTNAVFSSGTGATGACYASGNPGNNTLVCWGLDSGGYILSTNTAVAGGVNFNAQGPILTAGATLPLLDVRMGTNYGAALGANGAFVTWGTNNSSGQHGASAPAAGAAQRVPGTFTAFGAGYVHICAIDGARNVQCRGSNQFGQLGRPIPDAGAASDTALGPALLPNGNVAGKFTSLASGFWHNCGIVEGTCGPTGPGKVVCWGHNDTSQLGRVTPDVVASAVAPVMAP